MNDDTATVLGLRVAALERAALAGNTERHLRIREIAAGLNRSPATIRNWTKDGAKRIRFGVDEHMAKDRTGRWTCTASALRRWRYWLISEAGR